MSLAVPPTPDYEVTALSVSSGAQLRAAAVRQSSAACEAIVRWVGDCDESLVVHPRATEALGFLIEDGDNALAWIGPCRSKGCLQRLAR